ncbi:DEAD/DEAH box helicase [Geodermatophilus sp. SYSU D00758]
MPRPLVARVLQQLLAEEAGQHKRQLLSGLTQRGVSGLTVSDVNRVLYQRRELFAPDGSTPPRWYLVEGTHAGIPSPRKPPASEALPRCYAGKEPRAWQREALAVWERNGRRGVVEAVTGTGKSTVGVLAAAAALEAGEKVLILVPGLELMHQWHGILCRDLPGISVGRGGDGSSDDLRRHQIVVSTMHHAGRNYMLPLGTRGLLIADEVHRCGAESFALALEPEFSGRLGLTATFERNDDGLAVHVEPYFGDVIAGCDYRRALDDEILARFRVGLLGVDFSAEERERHDEYDEKARTLRRRLVNDHGCVDEPFGEFMMEVSTLSTGRHEDMRATKDARAYLNAFSKRRQLLADCRPKMQALADLAPVLAAAERGLVFSETKDSAVAAATVLRAHGVAALEFTSGLRRWQRTQRLADFKSGRVRVLAAPRVLDEGIDVPQADVGVILATTKTRRQMIQRMGRVIRPKADGRPATFIVMYVRDTAEDPATGAHEAFLDQLTGIADEQIDFPRGTTGAELFAWHLGWQA